MTTRIEDITGRWTLVAYGAGHTETGHTDTDSVDLDSWMNGAPDPIPDYADAAGMDLTIAVDGTVGQASSAMASTAMDSTAMDSTAVTAAVHVFSHDGVLTDPTDRDGLFDGHVRRIGDRLYVFATGVFANGADPDEHRRLDDGDTAIADELRYEGDDLERIVSVAVDELYLYRYAYRYRRVDRAGNGPA